MGGLFGYFDGDAQEFSRAPRYKMEFERKLLRGDGGDGQSNRPQAQSRGICHCNGSSQGSGDKKSLVRVDAVCFFPKGRQILGSKVEQEAIYLSTVPSNCNPDILRLPPNSFDGHVPFQQIYCSLCEWHDRHSWGSDRSESVPFPVTSQQLLYVK